MTTTKLKITLPTLDEITAGMSADEIHPALPRAQAELAATEQALANARAGLLALDRERKDIATRVASGYATVGDYQTVMARRDIAAAALEPAAARVASAKAAVEVEAKRAKEALRLEMRRRKQALAEAVDQLAPMLERIKGLELALSRTTDANAMGLHLDWPTSLAADVRRVSFMGHASMASARASIRSPGG